MDVKTSEFYFYDYYQFDFMMVEENKLLKQLQEEAELCCNNERTEDEVDAAIGMMLMHYQAVSASQFTPKHKPIHHTISGGPVNSQHCESIQQPDSISVHNVQEDTRNQMRTNRKSTYSRSALLASCRNILKEFLSQNGM